jgi:hypothetical protein
MGTGFSMASAAVIRLPLDGFTAGLLGGVVSYFGGNQS